MGMPRSAGPNTQHEGVVKSKGEKYGFIEARGVQETYGKDALVSPKSTGADIYASLRVGSLVRFRLELENGRPVASRCQIQGGTIKSRRAAAGRAQLLAKTGASDGTGTDP